MSVSKNDRTGDELRAAIRGRTNRITDPRLLAALRDKGVEDIAAAARRCKPAGHSRANLIADNGHRKQWPKHYLDDVRALRETNTDEDVLAFIDAVAEAGRQEIYVGNGVPTDSVGEVLALEAIAEGESNRDTAKLIDAPQCASRKRTLLQSITYHMARADRVRRVLLRDLAGAR